MPDLNNNINVYISYAGNNAGDAYENSRDYIVKNICTQLNANGLQAREYKRDISYKESIQQFMDDIASADYIVLLISDKYLKSEYCMYEAIELLARNKQNLRNKIFPVLLSDAPIFETDNHLDYVLYWIKKHEEINKKLQGIDPQKTMSLQKKAIVYREISENIDALFEELNQMKQLDSKLIEANDYTIIVESILKEINKKPHVATQVQPALAQQSMQVAAFAPQLNPEDINNNIAAMSKGLNDFFSNVINKFDDQVLDSEKAKKEYINVKFDEISGEGELTPLTRDFIQKIRTETDKYEPYRRSLIISALSLGLIKKYDEQRARLLLDFVTDGEPHLSQRAISGLVLGLLDKADYLSDEMQRRLKKLRYDDEVQNCLSIIYSYIGNKEQLTTILNNLKSIDLEKFDFFKQTQNWFLPYYENNPILKENIANKKLAKSILDCVIFLGLDSTKYAVSFLIPDLSQDEIKNLDPLFESEKNLLNVLQSDEFKSQFIEQLEVSKYLLEFYIFGIYNKNQEIVDIVEDEEHQRKGDIYKMVMNPHTECMLLASDLFLKKEYTAAADALKPLLEDEPNNKKALYMTGGCYYLSADFSNAINFYEKAKAKGVVDEPFLYAALGDSYFNTGEYQKAITAYEQLLKIQANTAAMINIGRCYTSMEKPDFAKAIDSYKTVAALEPNNNYNLLLLGDCYCNSIPPDYHNAFIYYYKAFEITPDNLGVVEALDQLMTSEELAEADTEKKLKIYSKYIELDPQNIRPLVFKGFVLENKDQPEYDEAISYYKKALVIEPQNAYVLMCVGNTMQKLTPPDYEGSLKYLNESIGIDPTNNEALMHTGWAYFATGAPGLAKPIFEKCTDSEYALNACQNLGHIALMEHDENSARSYYKKSYDLFENKDDFFSGCIEDYQYLQVAGIDKGFFQQFLHEAVKAG